MDFPGGSDGKSSAYSEGLNFWVRKISWRRKWQPTPVFLPGESHGWSSLVGYSPWGRKESDTTERLHFHFSLSCIGEGNGNPLQCSCLENPRDGGTWAPVLGVTKSRTQLSVFTLLSWLNKQTPTGCSLAECSLELQRELCLQIKASARMSCFKDLFIYFGGVCTRSLWPCTDVFSSCSVRASRCGGFSWGRARFQAGLIAVA